MSILHADKDVDEEGRDQSYDKVYLREWQLKPHHFSGATEHTNTHAYIHRDSHRPHTATALRTDSKVAAANTDETCMITMYGVDRTYKLSRVFAKTRVSSKNTSTVGPVTSVAARWNG